MSVGEERPLGRALEETVGFVRDALGRTAPLNGVIDLPPFDQAALTLTHAQRRALVLEQLPSPIPLPLRGEQKLARTTPAPRSQWARRVAIWILFVLTVACFALPALSLAFGLAWFAVLVWPARRTGEERPGPAENVVPGRSDVASFELQIIWMARWQVAAIVGTRAWESDNVAGAARIDVAENLERLTERALRLLRFTSTSLPKPSRSQPELRRQWEHEQKRVESIRADLVEQVAALIIYREHLDRISDLLDQRDQMALLSERAAAFDEILPPSSDGTDLLGAAEEQRDLHANLASQVRYLAELAHSSEAGLRLPGSQRDPR